MFRALIDWMDRDWAKRKYNPVFAFAQRLIWALPLHVSIAAIGVLDALGFSRHSEATLTAFALGATVTLAVLLVSLYRWVIGYSRSDFQRQAKAEHRAREKSKQSRPRPRFKRDGS